MSNRWMVSALSLVACSGLAGVAAAAPSVADFTWEARAELEWAGSPLDPVERDLEMGRLQKALAAGQVDQALRHELVVGLSAAERQRIDLPGPAQGRYLVGINKPLGVTVEVPAGAIGKRAQRLAAGAVRGGDDGSVIWSAALRVPGATALRAHLTGVDLPAGAALWVYNLDGQAHGPYTGRGPVGDGDLFTHAVFGERLLLQLHAPAAARVPALHLAEVGVLGQRFVLPRFGPRGAFPADDVAALAKASNLCSRNADCVVNAACTSSSAVNAAKQAVASMLFSSGRSQYICTGGLIADTVSTSVIPYFLTARHCISKSGEASSLQTYFDYTTTCNSPNCTQPYNNPGDTLGATIKASGSSSDYSLLELASVPVTSDGTTAYLGWTATAVANSNGVQLYRISHPAGSPQAYSEQRVDTGKGTCSTLPRGPFIYSTDTLGGTEGGSSGSPVVNGSGQVVGQLYGACGFNVNDSCDAASNATVDGAFAAYFSSVAPFLDPGSGGGCSPSGASCSSNGQCCSGSCKGKPGSQTCR